MRCLRNWLKWKKAQLRAVGTGLVYLQHSYNRIRFEFQEPDPAPHPEILEAERQSEIAELEYLYGEPETTIRSE